MPRNGRDMLNRTARLSRTIFVVGLVIGLTLPAAPATAQTQPLPGLIKIVVPFAAGASTDLAARAVATELADRPALG